jgi:two-component system sensor histidine kinase KdpD
MHGHFADASLRLQRKGDLQMTPMRFVLPAAAYPRFSWKYALLDSVLAFTATMLVTLILYTFHLYPRIPNISIVYLLVVLALASTRGRFAAILASLVAFLSFDYFLVPPLFIFTMNRVEEWIALVVFLITAILTSQLAVSLRERALEAARRESETRILYELGRVTHRATEPESQLYAIARQVVDVLSTRGVHDCTILQTDAAGLLQVQACASRPVEQVDLSSEAAATAAQVLATGRAISLHDATASSAMWHKRARVASRVRHFVPLKLGEAVVGVLCLQASRDSRPFFWEASARVVSPTSFFSTFLTQVTALVERARLQREKMHVEVLQRTDALRAALLSSVSHDLRTPLTSIKASASALLQEDVEWKKEERQSFVRAIEREADRLNRLVGNLLDMSRIEEGALKPERDEYSLRAIIHDVLARLAPLLGGREVCLCLPPDDLLLVDVDYLQIDQVLTNLLENAVRYTPPGSSIEVSAQSDGQQVTFCVADRGPGLPTSELTRVFDKFYRVLSPGRRAGGYPMGSGLGLAVCKGLVEAHGGCIRAQVRPGGGLAVSVVLPRGSREGVEV